MHAILCFLCHSVYSCNIDWDASNKGKPVEVVYILKVPVSVREEQCKMDAGLVPAA